MSTAAGIRYAMSAERSTVLPLCRLPEKLYEGYAATSTIVTGGVDPRTTEPVSIPDTDAPDACIELHNAKLISSTVMMPGITTHGCVVDTLTVKASSCPVLSR